VSAAGTYEVASGLATPGTITAQATPTVDATVTALDKEKLVQEVQQLKNQNEPDLLGWLRTNASILLSTLVVVVGALVGLFRWLGDRRDEQEEHREDHRSEQEKRAEERFQKAVEGLGGDNEGAKVGAAIMLRTFFGTDYKQFYRQTFDLAVAHLRLARTSEPPKDPNTPLLVGVEKDQDQKDPNAPLPLTTLRQALIVVFKEAFPLARDRFKEQDAQFLPQSLDATGVQLDNAYLAGADLKQAWMPEAFLRQANFSEANLSEANLSRANLNRANLSGANLNRANLSGASLSRAEIGGADLSGANFSRANLSKAYLRKADLSGANLSGANLSEARLRGADLSNANLSGAFIWNANLSEVRLRGADLSNANLGQASLSKADLSKADLSKANFKDVTDLRGVKGLTKEQLEAFKAKGAIIDEDTTTSSPQLPIWLIRVLADSCL
jgi:uncharacterized protein YjbI with pentapeptide repeats